MSERQYAVLYTSSKGEQKKINEMPTPYLLNAYRKLITDPEANPQVREAMEEEMGLRGLDPALPNSEQPPAQVPPPAEEGGL